MLVWLTTRLWLELYRPSRVIAWWGFVMVTYIALMGPLVALFVGFVTLAAEMVQLVLSTCCVFLVTRWVIRLSMVLQWVTALGLIFSIVRPDVPSHEIML